MSKIIRDDTSSKRIEIATPVADKYEDEILAEEYDLETFDLGPLTSEQSMEEANKFVKAVNEKLKAKIEKNKKLEKAGIWNFVENGFLEPANQQAYQALSQAEKDLLEENKKKDAKALFFIQQAMDESIFPKVATTTRSKQAWDICKQHTKAQTRKKQYDMNKQKTHFTNENQPNTSEQETILIACNVAQEISKEVRFLDSSCSNHMSCKKEMFATMDDLVKSKLKLGNDQRVSVMGKGSINIRTKQGEEKHISDVYYVPRLQHSLISIGQLAQKGYRIYFKNDKCVILDKKLSNRLIAKVEMTKNRMFPLRVQSELFVEPQGLQKVVELAFKASYKN
ncbi:uncharacterized protein LOC131859382 [Cryptomeria japonica]|uniref:uncharacterized protein LOC131859382 n=1 Tax=Cryptomeria japonica TaxID=3369 RepID=UPI0027D9EBB8|nr:uncharacterized protein LOC131859382 [Cryptomeria japonica]